MPTYLVFGYYRYYPSGGMNDCTYVTTDLEEAKNYVKNRVIDWDRIEVWEVIDGVTNIVEIRGGV